MLLADIQNMMLVTNNLILYAKKLIPLAPIVRLALVLLRRGEIFQEEVEFGRSTFTGIKISSK